MTDQDIREIMARNGHIRDVRTLVSEVKRLRDLVRQFEVSGKLNVCVPERPNWVDNP